MNENFIFQVGANEFLMWGIQLEMSNDKPAWIDPLKIQSMLRIQNAADAFLEPFRPKNPTCLAVTG